MSSHQDFEPPGAPPEAAPPRSLSWSKFYEACRREMEFRYGRKRVPMDYYKEHYAPPSVTSDVSAACRDIHKRLQAQEAER